MRHPRLAALAAILTSLAASDAHAWDSPTHTAIVRSAALLSPAFEARLPKEHAEHFWRELEEPDLSDRICRYHRGPEAVRNPFAEADRLMAELRKPGLKPYARAQLTGRFLHYVADCAVPAPIAQGSVFTLPNFWLNQDFVLFRQRRPDAASFLETLRQADADTRFSDGRPNGYPGILRTAVNLTVDAGLLLPIPVAAASAPPDAGPVLFLVNRVDNGFSGTSSDLYIVTDYQRVPGGVQATSRLAEITTGGEGRRQPDLLSREGVTLAEASWHRAAEGTTYRALLLNNMKSCAHQLRLVAGGRSLPLDGTLRPSGLATFEVALPPGLPPEQLAVAFTTTYCQDAALLPSAVDSSRRLVYGSTGAPPRFDQGAKDPEVFDNAPRASTLGTRKLKGSAQDAFGGSPDFELPIRVDDAALGQLAGWLSLSDLSVKKRGEGWTVRLVARNVGTRPLGKVELTLRSESENGETDTETLALDLSSLQPGRSQELSVAVTPATNARPERFQLTDVRRGEAPRPTPNGKAPAVQNLVPLK